MDRQFVYPGSIPLDTDILNLQRNVLVALDFLAQMTIGEGPVFDGLACTVGVDGSSVTVGPGVGIGQLPLDPAGFGSLPALGVVTSAIGCNLQPVSLPIVPPASGLEQSWLIQASVCEVDSGEAVLPYWNAANPSLPFSGPGGNGGAQATQRLRRVSLLAKAGAVAAIGASTAPIADAGWVGLYEVVVTARPSGPLIGPISLAANAPFLAFKLPQLRPGFSQRTVYTASGSFMVPANVSRLRIRLIGGGGGGGGCGTGAGGGGGGAGGYAEGAFGVVPGETYSVIVGSGGAGASGGLAGSGGSTSFANWISATGGTGGVSNGAGGEGGQGYGGDLTQVGGCGGDGFGNGVAYPGNGGAGAFGGGGRASVGTFTATVGAAAGSGGGGCYALAGSGGGGAAGMVIVEY